MSMQFYPTAPSLGLSSSSGVADFTTPLSYSSIFFTPPTSNHSTRATTTAAAATPVCVGSTASDLSLLMLDYQDLLNRHKSCLTQLQKTFKEAETLRQDNTNLRVTNCDLNERLNHFMDVHLQNQYASMMTSSGSSSLSPEYVISPLASILENSGGLHVCEKIREAAAPWGGCESPTSVIESSRGERDRGRISLPKSISVRSTGFLKAATQATPSESTTAPICGANWNRNPKDGPQKVYVRGGNKDGPIELDVYNQGMFKTELCNKWQETGACPYGDHCQFAHGYKELRPLFRHPLYKTELCRMILAGYPCPYGHRCHFRHALTEQEKLTVPLMVE